MQSHNKWKVEVEVINTIITGEYDEWDLLENFASGTHIISVEQNPNNKNIIVYVQSHTASAAAAAAEDAIACLGKLLGTLSVVSLNVYALDKQVEPHNMEPKFNKLVGRAAAAHATTAVRTYGLDVTTKESFPSPAAKTKSGPLWHIEDVEKWWEENSN